MTEPIDATSAPVQVGVPGGHPPDPAIHQARAERHVAVTGRVVGALFLAAFMCYGLGSLLVESVTAADDIIGSAVASSTRLRVGALLMLANSVVVATIGVLMLRVLWPTRRSGIAVGYLVARAFEAAVLAVGVVAVLLVVPAAEAGNAGLTPILSEGNDQAFQIAMVGLGIGSVPFCWALGREMLVPRLLAGWGAIGYALFAVGAALEILDVSVGLVLAAPAGLFEVAFGVYLLVRSMPLDPTATRAMSTPRQP